MWVTEVNSINDDLQMKSDIGELTGRINEAIQLVALVNNEFTGLTSIANCQPACPENRLRTAYLIWRNPYMTIGGDTFINDMILQCGFENVFASKTRYPEISIAELQTANCKLLLLSSEPYPFKQNHIDELQQHLPNTKIVLVDGEMFSWYGSRLLQSPQYFKQLLLQIQS